MSGFDYLVGVDLGQVNDYTAIAVAEEPVWIGPPREWSKDQVLWPRDRRGWVAPSDLVRAQAEHFRFLTYRGERPHRPPLYLRHLERLRHVSYSAIVEKVRGLLARPALAEADVALLVDHSGVGRAVFDQMQVIGLRPIGITITGGTDVAVGTRGGWNVPKRDLITSTQMMLQDSRLRIASGLPDAATLTKELLDYRVKISQTGHDSYDAREGQHDDMVLAVSLICWFRDFYWKNYDARAERNREDERMEAYR